MDYGKALRITRALAGLQQKELAELAKLDPSHISLIENGKRKPSLKTIRVLSGVLGVPTNLFTLLASEPDDFALADPMELEEVGKSLVSILLPESFQRHEK